MKRILALLLAIGLGVRALAATYTSDGSLANTQSLVNGASPGDTVIIGPVGGGTYSWTGTLTVGVAGLTVWGGGSPQLPTFTDTATIGAFTNLTAITQGSNVPMFQLNASGITLGGFTINGEFGTSGSPCQVIQVNNDWCHVRNIYHFVCAGTPPIVAKSIVFNHVYGEVDHVSIDNTNNTGSGQNGEFIYGTGHTDAWSNVINAGNAGLVTDYFSKSVPQQVVIENCTWIAYTACALEFDGDGRFTVRHCTFTNAGTKVDMHGLATNGAPSRGGRLAEVYSNAWSNATGDFNPRMEMRGGTFYIYSNSNSATGTSGWWDNTDYGYIDFPPLYPNFSFTVSSISTGGVVTTTAPHLLGPNGTTFTTSAGVQLYSTTSTPTFSGGTNVGVAVAGTVNSPTTFTITNTVTGAGTSGFVVYPQTAYQYPLLDQVGRGSDVASVPFTGSAAGNPAYSWSNTQGAGLWPRTLKNTSIVATAQNLYNAITGLGTFGDNDVVKEDRDWFTDLTVNGGSIGGPGNGSTGVGVGTLAQRPASPTLTNVGYWATDTSTLYTWSGSAWTTNYQPFAYPYLGSGGGGGGVRLSALTHGAVHY